MTLSCGDHVDVAIRESQLCNSPKNRAQRSRDCYKLKSSTKFVEVGSKAPGLLSLQMG